MVHALLVYVHVSFLEWVCLFKTPQPAMWSIVKQKIFAKHKWPVLELSWVSIKFKIWAKLELDKQD